MTAHNQQAGMSYAQPQAEAVSLNSWLVIPPFGTLNRRMLNYNLLKINHKSLFLVMIYNDML